MFSYTTNVQHTELIECIVRSTGCETYLELGIYVGATLNRIIPLVKRAIGVDNRDVRTEKIGEFYCCTTDDFFRDFNDKIDIIFIDADHHFESAKKDLHNSLRILNKHGIIFIHDTDPIEEKHLCQGYCGDSYKIIDYINNEMKDLSIVTISIAEAGISIIKRKEDRRLYDYLVQ